MIINFNKYCSGDGSGITPTEGTVYFGKIGYNNADVNYFTTAINDANNPSLPMMRMASENYKPNYTNDTEIIFIPVIESTGNEYQYHSFAQGAKNLMGIPQLDFSSRCTLENFLRESGIVYLQDMDFGEAYWGHCLVYSSKALRTVGVLNMPKIESLESAFAYCTGLLNIDGIVAPKCQNFNYTFNECSELQVIKRIELPTDIPISLNSTFAGCRKLSSIPYVDVTNATSMNRLFEFAESMPYVPITGTTSNCTDFEGIFRGMKVTELPEMDTTNIGSGLIFAEDCTELVTVPEYNCTNLNTADRMFNNCPKMQNMGGLTGLRVNLDLSTSPLLTKESLLNIINKAADLTGVDSATLTLGSTNLGKLSEDDKALATAKNWILA